MAETRQQPLVERRCEEQERAVLKKKLNIAQLTALNSLEQFGWYLKFVRHEFPDPPIAVLCDPDKHRFAILDAEGNLHENPVFERFRKDS